MFTSKHFLNENLGVDPEIAAFFVDRKVPADNQYWKGRLLYVARGTGFLFIPLLADLMHKAGVDKALLLSEEQVGLMESILDKAARYENGDMDFATHIQVIASLVENRLHHPWLKTLLDAYFAQPVLEPMGILGEDNPPLNRADALLYWFTAIPVSKETVEKLIGYWYALVPTFLLLDDLDDVKEDQASSDENAIRKYGFDAAGVRRGIEVLEAKFRQVGQLNPLLQRHLQEILANNLRKPYYKHILNE